MNSIYMTTGKFAALCNTTKETLYYYKEIGLLIPEVSKENGYFYYLPTQFFEFDMIRLLRDLGFSTNEIKDYVLSYGPEKLISVMKDQLEILNEKKRQLEKIMFSINGIISTTELSLTQKIGIPHLVRVPARRMIITPLDVPHPSPEEAAHFVYRLYSLCLKDGIDRPYPLHTIFSKKAAEEGKFEELYYGCSIYDEIKSENIWEFPEGFCVTIVHKGGYDTISNSFAKAIRFIKKKSMEIVSDGYVTDLVGNIMSKQNFENFVLEITIPVRILKQSDLQAE